MLSNCPLNKIAVNVKLRAQPVKFIDEAFDFVQRELSHPPKQCAEIVGDHFVFRARCVRHGSRMFRLVKTSADFHF